jgi:hypothetical protein
MVPDKDANPPALTFDELCELKKADRAELMALSPDEAQAAVERVLHPRLWRIENPEQLSWPGDLADDEKGG